MSNEYTYLFVEVDATGSPGGTITPSKGNPIHVPRTHVNRDTIIDACLNRNAPLAEVNELVESKTTTPIPEYPDTSHLYHKARKLTNEANKLEAQAVACEREAVRLVHEHENRADYIVYEDTSLINWRDTSEVVLQVLDVVGEYQACQNAPMCKNALFEELTNVLKAKEPAKRGIRRAIKFAVDCKMLLKENWREPDGERKRFVLYWVNPKLSFDVAAKLCVPGKPPVPWNGRQQRRKSAAQKA